MKSLRWLFGLAVVLGLAAPAVGQSIGYGASPGRAAYRPAGQWNDGPFYTAPHVDPYAPHRSSPTNLYAAEPLVPPWTSGPHGLYGPFYPGEGKLSPYAEGFSPYSGFSNWYARSRGIEPTREVVAQARTLFFRSAPRPPEGVLPPLPPPSPVMSPVTVPTTGPALRPGAIKIVVPARGVVPAPPGSIPVYRSSVAGGNAGN